jgi:hypothetical protein
MSPHETIVLGSVPWGSNSVLGVSENHAPSALPLREPRFSIWLDTRKIIAVQRSLVQVIQAQAWFAGQITIPSL